MRKALSELQTAEVLAQPDSEHPDTGVYHCQQAGEKALKAFLAFADLGIVTLSHSLLHLLPVPGLPS